MKKFGLLVALVLLFWWPINASADKSSYCFDYYDEYRNIKYWADKSIRIHDQNYGSNDALDLKLTYKKNKYATEPVKAIIDHFNNEFDRLIKCNLPFHDAMEGWGKRSYRATIKENISWKEFNSTERARRRSLYGSNPAALYCTINIKNKKFPILYHIECQISADEDLGHYGLVKSDDLGFSSPEYIEGEIKTAITEQLEKLAETMKKINQCREREDKQ